jgi:hypothetical protein
MRIVHLFHKNPALGAVQRLPNGGTRVRYNGKVYDLAGRVIRADELAESTKVVKVVVDEDEAVPSKMTATA